MSTENINLNYLKIFNAIYIERNITRAAFKLSISQSAVSQTLKKLRDLTGDPLFYSNKNKLTPTAHSIIISEGLDTQLKALSQRLQPLELSMPNSYSGQINIAVSSVFFEVFSNLHTTQEIFKSLPDASINITTWNENTVKHIAEGKIQIGLNMGDINTDKSVREIVLQSSSPVILARKEHPWLLNNRECDISKISTYPLGSILLSDLADHNQILQLEKKEAITFKYRSASMSMLENLTKTSDLITFTESLSASTCCDELTYIQPKWLIDLLSKEYNYSLYLASTNHHVELYQHIYKIFKRVVAFNLKKTNNRIVVL